MGYLARTATRSLPSLGRSLPYPRILATAVICITNGNIMRRSALPLSPLPLSFGERREFLRRFFLLLDCVLENAGVMPCNQIEYLLI